MYAIGGLYLRLAHEFSVDGALHIRVPPLDPSLFVHRFASRLEFGEKVPGRFSFIKIFDHSSIS